MSKIKLFIAVAAVCGITVTAEIVKNPDANTLWIENGKDIKTSIKHGSHSWNAGRLGIAQVKDGKGFVFTSNPVKKHYITGAYLPVSPEYPWFCFKITDVKKLKGYRALGFGDFLLGANIINEVSTVLPGYYAVNIAQNSKLKKPSTPYLRIDQHGFVITFEYFKMVKIPDNYIEVSSDAIKSGKAIQPGDTVTFTVNLKESAENVTISFYKAYTMPKMKINGKYSINMKPLDKENKAWIAEIKLNTLSPTMGKGRTFVRNGIIIKANVEFDESEISVLTSMPAPVNIK